MGLDVPQPKARAHLYVARATCAPGMPSPDPCMGHQAPAKSAIAKTQPRNRGRHSSASGVALSPRAKPKIAPTDSGMSPCGNPKTARAHSGMLRCGNPKNGNPGFEMLHRNKTENCTRRFRNGAVRKPQICMHRFRNPAVRECQK